MRKGLFFISFIMLCDLAIAQRDDLIKKYQDFRQQARKQHDDFRQRSNQVYADFMRKAWERFQALPKIPRPKDEELTPPVVYPGRDSGEIKDRSLPYEQETPIVQPQPKPILPIREQSSPVEERFSFLFFGTPCEVRAGEQHRFKLKTCESNELATTWSQLSGEAYDHLIKDCLDMRERLQLCDWAYLLFLEQLANSFLGKGTNEATLFMAFLYCQSGYRMRLAESSGKLYLLFASEHLIYDWTYWKIDGKCYYALNCKEKSLNICPATFPNSQALSLLIQQEPLFTESKTAVRVLQVGGLQGEEVAISSNKNMLDFYSTYPASMLHGNFMTRWFLYAEMPLREEIKRQLYPVLQKFLVGKSQLEAANFLISFVQHAFVYGYDDKIWGNDRAFFAEETLYYPYSDCEDRSILFTRLIRDLLGLEVALAYAPGHLFTAVKFTEHVEGAYFLIDNEKYIVCEPTSSTGVPVGWSAVEEGCNNIELIRLPQKNHGTKYLVSPSEAKYKRSLFPICMNGKYGYKNSENKIIVPCEYDSLVDSKQGDKFLYGAIKANKMTLFDYDGCAHIGGVEGYIPLEVNCMKLGMKGDFFAILKFDGEWQFVNLVFGPLDGDFSFEDYDMDDVSFEENIYCKPQSKELEITEKFIILKKKVNNKYGVLELTASRCIIPFEYDNISFVDGDKSKVKVYNTKTNKYKIIPLE